MEAGKDFVGQDIHGYKIMKPIGQGKFSTVYKAENAEGHPVAVKKIKIFDMMDPKQREKCLKQVDLMKPLSHPNIIQYIDSFTHNNQLIIVTQWAEKGDLKRLIKDHQSDENPFEQIRIWDFIIQISSALKHMHEKRIMHRDLKPANIFIAQDDSLKVGDLGLGREFGSQTIEAHSKVGTPLYMSPELLRDEGYNTSADVWSLGCIAYEFVELRSPFRNQNEKMSLMDLFNNITKGQFKPINNRYSPQLAQLIKRMIVVDPNRRLSSAEVLKIAQENFNKLKKSPKIDCHIVMEDIINKLNLIDYGLFCKVAERKPIHRAYFAIADPSSANNEQLYHFIELCYWLINLAKVDRSKEKAVIQAKTMIDWKSAESASQKFLNDLQTFGIRHEFTPKNILPGYGETVCHLLNQLLNRELIRINFKFQVSEMVSSSKLLQDEYEQLQVDEEMEFKPKAEPDEDIEETLQFQRSVLFRRGRKVQYEGGEKLLEKIKEIDEDTNIIVGQADPKDWQMECVRVDKQLANIVTQIKEKKKSSNYDNFERIKCSSSKINDLIPYVKHSGSRLYEQIHKEAQKIIKGQRVINSNLGTLGSQFGQKNKIRKELTETLSRQTSYANQKIQELEGIESKLSTIQNQINNLSSDDQQQPVAKLRQAITNMKKQLNDIRIRQGIIEWQLRKYNDKSTQEEYAQDFSF